MPYPPSPFIDKDMVTTGQQDIVGRFQRPRTLPSGRSNEDNEDDKEYPGSDDYKDKEDKGTDDASMGAEAPLPELKAIMSRIQDLASKVASIQLRYTGGQPQGRATRRRPASAIEAPEATPLRKPPPVDE